MPNVVETSDAAAGAATTYSLNIGDIVQGRLTAGSDTHDWYRVNLVAGQTYTFAEVGTGTNNLVDSFLRLYASNGTTLLASNDDGLPNANSIFTFTPTASGTYYLDAGSYNNAYSGQYGLTVAAGTRPSFDIQMGAGVIDTNASWSATPGTAANVTFGFRQSAATYVVADHNIATFSQVSAAQMTAIQTALQFCADVCNITFTAVNPGGYTNNATMLFADYTDPADGSGAFAFSPGSTAANSAAGDVWLNTDSVSRTALSYSSYSFFAIIHEIGHALGLSHPGLYNAAPGTSITYANNAQFTQDSNQWTMMSYFDEDRTGAQYSGYAVTPLILDIYALQQIYGANTNTRTGDTVYGFGSNAGAVYTATAGSPALAYSIWDAGGIDTINMSGYGQAQRIDLNAGSFSNTGGLTANISIALGAVIENATGGSGGDTLIGNAAANILTGNAGNDRLEGFAGNDTLYGGAESDTAIYHAARATYSITQNPDGSVRVAGGDDGTDTVYQVEFFQFTDRASPYALSELFGPASVVSALAHRDFNADGTSDVLLRNTNGMVGVWDMANGQIAVGRIIDTIDGSWSIEHTGDFNADGTSDILLRAGNGDVFVWDMDHGQIVSEHLVDTIANTWTLEGTGDFNADGTSDVLLYNTNGNVAVWDMDAGDIGFNHVINTIDRNWSLERTGDFNGDGVDDVLLRYTNGSIGVWNMANGQIALGHIINTIGREWTFEGVGDFNADGTDDILLRSTNGSVGVWDMANGEIARGHIINTMGPEWTLESTGDYNGDGTDDVLLRHTNGSVGVWDMHDGQIALGHIINTVSGSWDLIA